MSSGGYTILTISSQCGHTEAIEVLLNRGAQIEAKSTSRHTALTMASENGHVAAIEALLNRGAQKPPQKCQR
jgi:uncharacterized protein